MKKNYFRNLAFTFIMSISLVSFGQGDRKKIVCVGGDVLETIQDMDKHLNDTISTWVDVTYTSAGLFNALTIEAFDTIDGVIFYESIGSNTVGNFGNLLFPVPSITMEAGVFINDAAGADPKTRWNMSAEDGGVWGYGSAEGVSEIDLHWIIDDISHPICTALGYDLNQDITWSEYPTPADYGLPYLHHLTSDVTVIARPKRTDPGPDADNAEYDQSLAIAVGEFPIEKILFLNAAKTYVLKGNPTDDFYLFLEQAVYYMFDAYPVSVEKVKPEDFNLSTYPNPASDNLGVSFQVKSNHDVNLSLVNIAGQSVYSTTIVSNPGVTRVDVNVSDIAAGIYMVKLEINNDVTYSKVVIK